MVMFVYREEYYLNKREPERKMEESEDTFNLRHDEWLRKMQNSENKALFSEFCIFRNHSSCRKLKVSSDSSILRSGSRLFR